MLPDFVKLSQEFGLLAVLSLMSALALRRSLPVARRGWGHLLVLPPIVTLALSAFGVLVFIFVQTGHPRGYNTSYSFCTFCPYLPPLIPLTPQDVRNITFVHGVVNGLMNWEPAIAGSVLGISLYTVALLAIGRRISVQRA
jgi:hypothetical protein